MLNPNAILRFADRQKRLLRQTYDTSWQRGASSYQPDDDPEREPTLPLGMAVTGLTGAGLLVARQRYKYVAPVRPDPVRRVIALSRGFEGVNSMAGQLVNLSAGGDPKLYEADGDPQAALNDWIGSNGWRLDAGDAVAWAGEQAGYAEAANADGQLLYSWMSVGDSRVCSDCEQLSGFPPMALGDWPTSPGAGDTECMYGCRCGWDTWDGAVDANYAPSLSPDQNDLVITMADRQAQSLVDMIPDVAYLEG